MLLKIYIKSFISSLICISALRLSAAEKWEIPVNEAALRFGHKWLAAPNMYVSVMLPNKYPFRVHDVVRLAKGISSDYEELNVYLRANKNLTKYNTIRHTRNELIWYPFNTENYDMDCTFLDASRYHHLSKKHFLFFYEDDKTEAFSFESCKIGFDSRLAVYRRKKNNKTIVEFEEIYKIIEHEHRLEKNALGSITLGKDEIVLSGLNLYIWKRRKSLKGKRFNAVIKKGTERAVAVKNMGESEGKVIIQHRSYHIIMNYLMRALNFSLNVTVLNMTYNDIVMEISSGRYDIGYNSFIHSLLRSDNADFAFEFWDRKYGLFYIKENQKFSLGTFLYPFTSPVWILLATYVLVLVIGFILIKMVKGNDNRFATLQSILGLLQKGSDFVFRSLIAKRQRSEPRILSSKISFLVLVFAGFVIFTMYRAVLVAFLVVEEENPPIGNLKELMNSDYSLVVRKGTQMDTIFSNANAESDEYELYKNGKIVRFLGQSDELVKFMVEKDPIASMTILFDIYGIIAANKHYPCNIAKIPGFSRKAEPAGMLFRKRWPWTDLFNYHLLLMKERGMFERLYHHDRKKRGGSCPNEYIINRIVNRPRPIDTNKPFSLYIALGIGFLTSLLILTFEKFSIRQNHITFDVW